MIRKEMTIPLLIAVANIPLTILNWEGLQVMVLANVIISMFAVSSAFSKGRIYVYEERRR